MASSTRKIQSIFDELNIFPGQRGATAIVLEYLLADDSFPTYVRYCYDTMGSEKTAIKIADDCLRLLREEPKESNPENKEQKKPAVAEGVANALSEIEPRERLVLFGHWRKLADIEEKDHILCSHYRLLIAYFLPVPDLGTNVSSRYRMEKVHQYLENWKAPQEVSVLPDQVVHQEEVVPLVELDLTQGLVLPKGQDDSEEKIIVPEALVHVLRIKIALAENEHGKAKTLMRKSSRHLNISGAELSGAVYTDGFFLKLNLSCACLENIIFGDHFECVETPRLKLTGANLFGARSLRMTWLSAFPEYINQLSIAKGGLDIRFVVNEENLTLLLYCAKGDFWRDVKSLLEAGADPTIVSGNNESLLSVTMKSDLISTGSAASVSQLLVDSLNLNEQELEDAKRLSEENSKKHKRELGLSFVGAVASSGAAYLLTLAVDACSHFVLSCQLVSFASYCAVVGATIGEILCIFLHIATTFLALTLFLICTAACITLYDDYKKNKLLRAATPSAATQAAPSPTQSHAPQDRLDAASMGRAPAVTPGTVSEIGLTGSAQAKASRDTGVGLSPPPGPRG